MIESWMGSRPVVSISSATYEGMGWIISRKIYPYTIAMECRLNELEYLRLAILL
jgi:hypothetical protein